MLYQLVQNGPAKARPRIIQAKPNVVAFQGSAVIIAPLRRRTDSVRHTEQIAAPVRQAPHGRPWVNLDRVKGIAIVDVKKEGNTNLW